MNLKITTYQDLLDALKGCTPDQLSQPIINGACDPESQYSKVTEIEVQPYDFYQHIDDEDDFGTLSELHETHDLSFKLENYKIFIPKGSIILR